MNSDLGHNAGTLSCRGHCISVVTAKLKNIHLFNTNVYYIFVMLRNIWVHFKSIFFRFTAEARLSSWILVQPKTSFASSDMRNFQRCRNIIMLGLCPYKSGQPVFFKLCRLEYHFQKKVKDTPFILQWLHPSPLPWGGSWSNHIAPVLANESPSSVTHLVMSLSDLQQQYRQLLSLTLVRATTFGTSALLVPASSTSSVNHTGVVSFHRD